MKKYKVTNPATGKSYAVTMEAPPTPEDVEEIFASQPAAPPEPQGPSFEDSANVYAEQDMSAAVPSIPKSPEEIAAEKRQAEFRAQPKLNQFAQGAKAFATGTLSGIQKMGRVLPMSDLMVPEKNPQYEEEMKKDPKSASYYVRKDDRKEFNAKKDKETEAYLQDYALASAGVGVEDIPYYGLDMLATAIPGFKGAKWAAKFKYAKPIAKAAAEGAAWAAPALGVHQAQAVAETGKLDPISGTLDLATSIPLSALAKAGGKVLQKSGAKDLYKNLARVPDLQSANPLTKKNVTQALEADMVPAFGSAENVSEVATGNLREAEAGVRAERADAAKQASFKPEKRVEMQGGIGSIKILSDNSQIVSARDLPPEQLEYSLRNVSNVAKEYNRGKSKAPAVDLLASMLQQVQQPAALKKSNYQFLRNPSGDIIGGVKYAVTDLGIEVELLASLEKGKGKELLGYVENVAKKRDLPIHLQPLRGALDFYKKHGYSDFLPDEDDYIYKARLKDDPSKVIKTSPTLMSGKIYNAEDIGMANKYVYSGTPFDYTSGMGTDKINLGVTNDGVFWAGDKPGIADNYSMSATHKDRDALLNASKEDYPFRPNTRPYKINPKAKIAIEDFTSIHGENFPTTEQVEQFVMKHPEADIIILKNTKDVGEGAKLSQVQDQYMLTPKGKKTGAFIERYTGEMGSSLGIPTPKLPKAPEQKTLSNLTSKPNLTNETRRAVPAQAALNRVKATLEKERLDPTLNKSVESDYDDAAEALAYWADEAAKRTTAKGPHKHMSVEDALSFRQAIDKQVNFRKTSKDASKALTPGFARVSAMVRAELEKIIEQAAPDVTKKTKELADLIPVREAFQKKAVQEGARKPTPWSTADVFTFGGARALRSVQNNPAYGAAKYKVGRGMQGQAPQTLAAFSRTGTSQHNKNKKKGSK